jgi:hypothetical protein
VPRTNFRPEIDGFAFQNSWSLDQGELGSVRAAFDAAVVVAVVIAAGLLDGLAFPLAAAVAVWIANGSPLQYGLCGGMSFAALDYFRLEWVVPRGTGSGDQPMSPGPGAPLRAYLWQRLLDSLAANASTFLGWTIVNNLVPSFWPFNGGSGWLLSQTRKEWAKLKAIIDAGEPWPVGLVGSGIDPFADHQVLVYGYNDPGDGTGSLFFYDCNNPGVESEIDFNLNGSRLVTTRDDTILANTLLGFFCENYSPSIPPVAIGLSQGLSSAPAGPVAQGARPSAKSWNRMIQASRQVTLSCP